MDISGTPLRLSTATPIPGWNLYGPLPPQDLRSWRRVGLDIDGRYLAAAQVNGQRVTRVASQALPDGVVRETARSSIANGSPRLSGASWPTPSCRARCAWGCRTSRSSSVWWSFPHRRRQRDAAVRFQAAEAIAMPLTRLSRPSGRLRPRARRHRAHAGGARGRAALDDRGAARGGQEGRASSPRASTSTPSLSSARWPALQPPTWRRPRACTAT